MTVPKLSIIIPVLDDAKVLSRLLDQLGGQTFRDWEVWVADGGSEDDSVAVAHQGRVEVVVSPPGRGVQMNAAASRACGAQLLFLHADSSLPYPRLLEDAYGFMVQHLARQPHTAGHFGLRFMDSSPENRWIWRFWEAKSRTNRPECIHGDQGLWISKEFFEEVGGFDTTFPFLEERRVAQAVAQRGQWMVLPGWLGTSARRFGREGVARRTILNAVIMACHALDHQDFLRHAPALYRQQRCTDILPMADFFHLLKELDRATPVAKRRERWLHAGRLLRHSVWQIFLLLDVWTRRDVRHHGFSFLRFYDRRLDSLLPRVFPDWVARVCAWSIVQGLSLYFRWSRWWR
ncbi:MAG: TIGR04283 family arsenosugar biosynthesis glycosyltransferase [Magnetococcales bacterium]|nr:TIGR04283 family arsenosugar biosynthesis glycosyltransferase [Magnetococcales bacterium]